MVIRCGDHCLGSLESILWSGDRRLPRRLIQSVYLSMLFLGYATTTLSFISFHSLRMICPGWELLQAHSLWRPLVIQTLNLEEGHDEINTENLNCLSWF